MDSSVSQQQPSSLPPPPSNLNETLVDDLAPASSNNATSAATTTNPPTTTTTTTTTNQTTPPLDLSLRRAQLQTAILRILQQNSEWSRLLQVLNQQPNPQPQFPLPTTTVAADTTILPLQQPPPQPPQQQQQSQQQQESNRRRTTSLASLFTLEMSITILFKIIPLFVILFILFAYFYLLSAVTLLCFVLLTVSANEVVKLHVQKSQSNLLQSNSTPSVTNSNLEEGIVIPPSMQEQQQQSSTTTSATTPSTNFTFLRLIYFACFNIFVIFIFSFGVYRKEALLQYLLLYPIWYPSFYESQFSNTPILTLLWTIIIIDCFIKLIDTSIKSVLVIALHAWTRLVQTIFKLTTYLPRIIKCHGPLYAIIENIFILYRSLVIASIWVLYFYYNTPQVFPEWISITIAVAYGVMKVTSWAQRVWWILKSVYYLLVIRGKEPAVGQYISSQEVFAYTHRQQQQQGEEEQGEDQGEDQHAEEEEEECCVICRCEYETPIQLQQSCKHVFCEACIDQWCKQQRRQHIDPPTCPICRTAIPQVNKIAFSDGHTNTMLVLF